MRQFVAALALCAIPAAFAQNADEASSETTELLKIDMRARADWQNLWHDSHTDDANSGFEGKFLMMRLDGQIVPGLTYSWRQRFNKSTFDGNFFDSTDWININYAVKGWNFNAGKQVVAIGGWEYDANPVDVFGYSVFTSNVACYQFGVSAAYDITPNDNLKLQIGQSIWHTSAMRNLYSYNLMWSGQHGIFKPLWSVNLTEYAKGRYISYIALGNRFEMGNFTLNLDLMNRAASHQAFFFKDASVVGELAFNTPDRRWRIHGKMSYDANRTNTAADMAVLAGTEMKMAGGGVEFFPLKKKRTSLRLHAACYYAWGKNNNEADMFQDKSTLLSFGVTWDMNLLNLHRK